MLAAEVPAITKNLVLDVTNAYHSVPNRDRLTAKRLLMTTTKSDGCLDWERNTTIRDLYLSPAQLFLGHAIGDLLPVRPSRYNPAETWINSRDQRELALRHKP